MSRQNWRDFICAPDRAGRHLSGIGRAVAGAKSDAIDLPVLQAFLDRLRNATDDVRFLGAVVDLIAGPYKSFADTRLPSLLDALSNEMLARERIVGPGLRGNASWDRTILKRMSGTISPVQYVSRLSHRSFELPENQLLSWLVEDLRGAVSAIEHYVGTSGLHADLQILRQDCEQARRHHWFGDLTVPSRPTPAMILAANRHRKPEYRIAAALAQRRLELLTKDHHAWWYSVLSLLAVDWLEPIDDDDLFELYVLVLTLDILSDELGFGEPLEYGLVTSRRGHVGLFKDDRRVAHVYFDQTPATIFNQPTEYTRVLGRHAGVSGGERRPDIAIVVKIEGQTRLILVEMKKSSDGRYISDSVYKMFAYLYDFGADPLSDRTVKGILVVPSGVSSMSDAPVDRSLFIASGDDRAGLAAALRAAMTA